MARRGRGQFQFTVTELAVLAASFTVTSVLVFFLGLYVGRDLAARHQGPDDRVARIPISENPPSMPPPLAVVEDEPEAAAAAAAPTAADQPAVHAAIEPPSGASSPRAATKPLPPTPPEPAARAGEPTGGRVPAALPAGILPAREAPAAQARVAEPGREAPLQAGIPYTVQVLATRNRKEAEALAADLKRQGYGAFLTPVEDTGGKWYRVRIGRYDDPQAARSMAERCKRELGLNQAYVSPF